MWCCGAWPATGLCACTGRCPTSRALPAAAAARCAPCPRPPCIPRKSDMKTFALLPLVGALLLAGCATALPELPAQPAPPAQFKEDARWTTTAPAEAQGRGEWWKAFADPQLDALVQRAAEANPG